jgi:hypothetical protein
MKLQEHKMAEQLNQPEQFESLPSPEQHEALPTPEQAEALRPGEADPVTRLEQAREAIEHTGAVENPIQKLEQAQAASSEPKSTFIDASLKQLGLKRELKQIRRSLPAADRALSHVIHQPVIRAVSEVTGKTLSRPSGLLGGGILAFVGTAGYYYLARHIGFTYNYTIFFELFIGGFAVGLFLELLLRLLFRGGKKPQD